MPLSSYEDNYPYKNEESPNHEEKGELSEDEDELAEKIGGAIYLVVAVLIFFFFCLQKIWFNIRIFLFIVVDSHRTHTLVILLIIIIQHPMFETSN